MLTVTLIGASRNAWGYLLESVSTEHTLDRAEGKAAYYMAGGTPPGAWAGAGLTALGLAREKDVTEEALRALFGEGTHPVTGESIGKAFTTPAPFEERVKTRIAELTQARTVEALLEPQHHGLDEDALRDLSQRIQAEVEASEGDQIRRDVMGESVKQSVAGFEFVFSPPKSVSAWWALADPELKDQIRQAHHAAIQSTIEKLETDIVRTRTGADGVAQSHVLGISAALFDHWDSRDGDPQLHTHMLVSNRVQGEDGRWRTIDSRWSLMPAVATAGAYYDGVLMDELSARFGIQWTVDEVLQKPARYQEWRQAHQRADTPAARHQFAIDQGTGAGSVKWQIDGVPSSLSREFSTRSQAITTEKDRLIQEYVAKHGRQPGPRTIIQMRQEATRSTRRAKRHRSLRELTQDWRTRARAHVGDSFLFADRLRDTGNELRGDYALWSFRHDDVDDDAVRDTAEFVLHSLATSRSTWGRRNAETAALRAIAGWRFRSADDRDQAVKRVVDVVLSQAIPLTPSARLHTPHRFRTASGENMFHPEARDLYTAPEIWDAEERLLEAGRATDSVTVDQALVDQLIGTPTGADARTLSDDQAQAVASIATSGRRIDVLVGPAGAGKTTSLQKLLELWEAQHGTGSVRGLAPSAAAAEVLSESLGIQTENTAKWLYETANTDAKPSNSEIDFELHAGDLMIIDESSLAGTIALDTLRAQAEAAGAKLLLVGDWAQLAAVDAGGAFGLLAADRTDPPELVNLHRFAADWEADASKLLRLGKTQGLDPYIEHGRITAGLDETIIQDAVDAWKADEATATGDSDKTLVSLLIAPTNDMVNRLNDIARSWRIDQGLVDDTRHATVASGVASLGDRIVTRENDRRLRTDHDRWVRNGDQWVVTSISDTGDIIAASGDEYVTLPAAYCAENVQLAYATTAHRSQGRTVDTAHTIVDSSASRETFYVAMTRGKQSNRAYVITDEAGQHGNSASTGMSRTWRETLEHVVLHQSGDISAHDTLSREADRIGSVRQLAAEYQTLIADQLERAYLPVLAGLGLVDEQNPDSPYLGPVLANLRRLEHAHRDIPDTVTRLLAERELGDARDVLAVLHYRLATYLEDVREFSTYDEYAPMLDAFGITVDEHADPGSALRFYRTLAKVDEQGVELEAAVRNALERIDRPGSRSLPAQLAATLRRQHRIDAEEITAAAGVRGLPEVDLIAGLIEPAPDLGEPDFQTALRDREHAIQLRAELLVDRALQDEEPWIEQLGTPLPGDEAAWRRRAVTVACYRDLYGVTTDEPLGREHAHARNRERDRKIAAAALQTQQVPHVQVRDAMTPAQPVPAQSYQAPTLS